MRPISSEIGGQNEIIRIVYVLLVVVGVDHVNVLMVNLLPILEVFHSRVLFAV